MTTTVNPYFALADPARRAANYWALERRKAKADRRRRKALGRAYKQGGKSQALFERMKTAPARSAVNEVALRGIVDARYPCAYRAGAGPQGRSLWVQAQIVKSFTYRIVQAVLLGGMSIREAIKSFWRADAGPAPSEAEIARMVGEYRRQIA